jgi:hypothetical protein
MHMRIMVLVLVPASRLLYLAGHRSLRSLKVRDGIEEKEPQRGRGAEGQGRRHEQRAM